MVQNKHTNKIRKHGSKSVSILRNLFSRYLYYEFTPVQTVKVKLIEKPNLWMGASDWDNFYNDIKTITDHCEITERLNYGVLGGGREFLDNAIVTIAYDGSTNQPVAFNAMYFMEVYLSGKSIKVLHLGLVMVDPKYRKCRLTWVLFGLPSVLLFFRNRLQEIWISNVTQVPAALGLVGEGFDDVYPRANPNTPKSFQHHLIAQQIMKNYRSVFGVGDDATFDSENFVIKNSYTGGSQGIKKPYEQTTHFHDNSYNEMCLKELDYERGDDFLQIGRLNLTAVKNYLLQDVPKGSLVSILYHLSFLLLFSVLVPVIQWFNSREQMGELRPWKRK